MSRPAFARIVTRRMMERRLMTLIGLIGASHFLVDIAADYLPREPLNLLRVAAAVGVGIASSFFEMYKGRRAE